jgi:hypothetical protein
MAIILKANKVNLFVSSVLFVFWYHSPNVLDTPHICNISWLRVKFLSAIRFKARIIAAVKNIDAPMMTLVWQELEYCIDVTEKGFLTTRDVRCV